MKKVVKVLFLVCFFTLVSVGIIMPSFAKGKDEAPGHMKKDSESQTIIGNIDEVKGDKVIVEEKKDKRKEEAIIDKTTKVVGKDNKSLKLKELKLKDMIAIIATDSGKVASDGAKIKKAIKVFVKSATESASLKRRAVHGIISNISGNQITVVHQIHNDRVYTFSINENTIIKSKSKIVSSSSLQVGQRIVAVGDLSEGGLVAKLVHIIPGKAIGVFRRSGVATPSATIFPSPGITATPSVTLIVTPTSTASGGI